MKRTVPDHPRTGVLRVAARCLVGGGWHEAVTKEDVANITKPQFSPYAGRNYPTRVFLGDTHLHTAISVDAGTM